MTELQRRLQEQGELEVVEVDGKELVLIAGRLAVTGSGEVLEYKEGEIGKSCGNIPSNWEIQLELKVRGAKFDPRVDDEPKCKVYKIIEGYTEEYYPEIKDRVIKGQEGLDGVLVEIPTERVEGIKIIK